MKKSLLWMLTAIRPLMLVMAFCGAMSLASCSDSSINKDNPTPEPTPGLKELEEWQAGAIVSQEAVDAFGIESCFMAGFIPDNVWQRMQGKTYKENPYIGRGDLYHVKVLHWDYDEQIHIGEMICSHEIASRVVRIMRRLYDAHYPIQRMVLPDVYDADDETQIPPHQRHHQTLEACPRVGCRHQYPLQSLLQRPRRRYTLCAACHSCGVLRPHTEFPL